MLLGLINYVNRDVFIQCFADLMNDNFVENFDKFDF